MSYESRDPVLYSYSYLLNCESDVVEIESIQNVGSFMVVWCGILASENFEKLSLWSIWLPVK